MTFCNLVCFILLNSMVSSRPLHRTIMKRQSEESVDIGAIFRDIERDIGNIYQDVR